MDKSSVAYVTTWMRINEMKFLTHRLRYFPQQPILNTLTQYSSIIARDQISHLNKPTWQTIVVHNLICKFANNKWKHKKYFTEW